MREGRQIKYLGVWCNTVEYTCTFRIIHSRKPLFLSAFFLGALALLSIFFDRLLVGRGGITSSLVEGSIGSSSFSGVSLAGDSKEANLLLVFTFTTSAAGTFALTFTSTFFLHLLYLCLARLVLK